MAGEAADGGEAVRLVPILRPDVVLMDVQMPRHRRAGGGPPAPGRLHGCPPVAGSSCSTTFDLDEYVFEALRAGASGFLLKNAPAGDLIAAIRTVALGDALLAPAVTRRVVEAFTSRRPSREAEDRIAGLSPREREVLRLVCLGLTNGEIADRLILGEATVKTHVGAILGKLGARDRVAAVITGYESGLVAPGEVDVGPPLPRDR